MATIKSYTSLEQSKKLTEILPLESADMFCADVFDKEKETHSYNFHILSTWGCNTFEELKDRENKFVCFIPCWSLSALLNILAKQEFIIKSSERNNEYQYNIDIPIRHCKIWFSSLLDAAFEMIIWLKENNKL